MPRSKAASVSHFRVGGAGNRNGERVRALPFVRLWTLTRPRLNGKLSKTPRIKHNLSLIPIFENGKDEILWDHRTGKHSIRLIVETYSASKFLGNGLVSCPR